MRKSGFEQRSRGINVFIINQTFVFDHNLALPGVGHLAFVWCYVNAPVPARSDFDKGGTTR